MVGSTPERGHAVTRQRKSRRGAPIEYAVQSESVPVLRTPAGVDWERFRRPELENEGARLRRLDAFVETFLDWVKS